jgi:hypothetical protein
LTDYAGLTNPPPSESPPLLALAGLRQLVQLIEQWQQQRR